MKSKFILLAFMFSFMMFSCGENTGTKTTTGHDEEVAYSCPHHPEVHEHEPGKCPKCGMDLVAQKDDHHDHGHDHGDGHEVYFTCTEHTGVHKHEPGKCPACGKDLVEKKE